MKRKNTWDKKEKGKVNFCFSSFGNQCVSIGGGHILALVSDKSNELFFIEYARGCDFVVSLKRVGNMHN